MRFKHILVAILLLGIWSCTDNNQKSQLPPSFAKYIGFNHLYITIDDATYDFLLDSLKILDQFSVNQRSDVEAGDESWSGIYLFGKHHYLEIFKQGGFDDNRFGDFGLAFMSDKLGTLDSVYISWSSQFDSVTFDHREMTDQNGNDQSWFNYVEIPNADSLHIQPWLMEHTKEHMMDCRYTEHQLENEIEYWDYIKNMLSTTYNISSDSIKYDKLFEKVTALHLTLSEDELARLQLYLYDFGFNETDHKFSKNDFEIKYQFSGSSHFILNQIDFSLLDSVPEQKQTFRNLDFQMSGYKASLKFNY